MKSVSRRIVRADPFSFRNIEEEELPSTWGGISACMYTRPRGIQGSGQPLSRGGSRRIPSNPPRSAHSSFCSPPLALSTTDPVYHESRKSRAPFVPPSLRGGGIRAHVRIEEPPVRLNIYTRRDKQGSNDIRGIRSFGISRVPIRVDRRGFHPFEWKFLKNDIDYIIRVYVLCFSLSAGVGSVERSVDVSFTRS